MIVNIKNIKSEIVYKNLSQQQIQAINNTVGDGLVQRETAKAVLITFNTPFGKINMWAPKSCISFN